MSNSFRGPRWLPIAALAAIGTIFGLPAAAQSDENEGEAAEDDPMVEEIVVTVTQLLNRLDTSKVAAADTQIKMLRSALQTYRLDVGSYPTTAQGLAALMSPPDEVATYWRGPYLDDVLPDDPWRHPYQYEAPVDNLQGFVLYSFGADSAKDGEGDNADIGFLPARSP